MNLRIASRAALGPFIVGMAAWCALGEVSVLTPDDPAIRVAAPAAWYLFPAAIVAASLVPGWRRYPATATPALLATLPWWPVSGPALALVWTGAMAWVPIGLAALAAVLRGSSSNGRATLAGSASWSPAAAAGCTVVIAAVSAGLLSPRLPGGDEPHYLIITQSLLQDGDLQIENNHAERDFSEYYAGNVRPDFKMRGQNGAIYSVHAPGTSVVVLPAFAFFGYRGAQGTVVLLAALASALIWYAGWLATGDRRAAWVAWLAVTATPTFIIQSVTIFPDSIAVVVVAASVVSLLRLSGAGRPLTTGALVGTSALLAVLPWLHTRFAVLAGGLGALVTWFVLVEAGREWRERRRRFVAFSFVPLAGALAWFAFFQFLYGTPNPLFPYGEDRGTRLAHVPGGLLGLFVDAQFGLLAYSPVLAAALVGLFVRRTGRPASAGLVARLTFAVGLVYLAVSATYWMWWAGVPASPARFAAAVLPTFVVPVAIAWRSASAGIRAVWTTLLTVSAAISLVVITAARGRIAWNSRGIRANWLDWLSGVADLSRAWPSFFWRLEPADLTSEFHFFTHVFIWAAIFGGSCAVLVRWLRSRPMVPAALPASWWLAVALLLAIQAGWWFNGSTGLSAATSQIAVLNASASGRRVLQIRPYSIGPFRDLTGRLRLRATRVDDVGEAGASWQTLLDVPPGQYDVSVSLRRPREGRLALRIGRSVEPLRRLTLAGVSAQTFPLDLPAGAGALFFEPDEGLSAAGDRIELTPRKLQPPAEGYAATSVRFGDADLYFYGPTIYLESDGFWARGGTTTPFVIAVERGRRVVNLTMTNGAAANDVQLAWSDRSERIALRPLESQTIAVDVSREGVAAVRLTSTSGYRPSDDGVSQDRRYLGIRVTVE
jgi:hypothetical protein